MKVSYYWGTISELKEAYDMHRSRIMDAYDMTALEVDILLFLANNLEFNTASDIVKERKISKAHVSTTIQSLYKKGMIEKKKDEKNPKKIHLFLTSKTKDIVKDGQKEQIEFLNNVVNGFTKEEIQVFLNDLKRISENIQNAYK